MSLLFISRPFGALQSFCNDKDGELEGRTQAEQQGKKPASPRIGITLATCWKRRHAEKRGDSQFRRSQTPKRKLLERLMVAVSALLTSGLLLSGIRMPHNVVQRGAKFRTASAPDRKDLATTPMTNGVLPSPQAQGETRSSETLWKAAALGALVLQNTGLAVTMRLSRIDKSPDQYYIASTAVVAAETIKVIMVMVLRLLERRKSPPETSWRSELRALYTPAFDVGSILFSSALYVVQNNLQYIATGSLPAAVYQVSVQLKTLTAALVAYCAYGKTITFAQWVSIFILTAGTIMVQLSATVAKSAANVNMQVGLTAVILSCLTSAVAGVSQEQALKNGKLSLWARNTQICSISLVLAILAALKDSDHIVQKGFFHGYSPLVWGVVLLQALGGLLVSIVVKQTDSVVKGFASSGAILLSCFVSLWLLQDVELTAGLIAGALLVSVATIGYGRKAPSSSSASAGLPSPGSSDDLEKLKLHVE